MRETWEKLMNPGKLCTLALTIASTVLLTVTFVLGYQNTVLGYTTYLLASYTTATLCFKVPLLIVTISKWLHHNSIIGRLLTDVPYRVWIGVRVSLCINVFYAMFHIVFGVLNASAWYGALAAYYLCLSGIRIYLMRKVPKASEETETVEELKAGRLAGAMMLLLSFAVGGIIIQIVRGGKGFHYTGNLIYAVAAYTFWSITVAIVSLVRYRKFNSPMIMVTKAISLSTALVSLFALQTAMFASFGGGVQLQRILNIGTGALIGVLIFMIAVFVLCATGKALQRVETNREEEEHGR